MAKLLVVLLVLCAALGSFADVTITGVISEGVISTTSSTLITVVGSGFTGTPSVKVSGVACDSAVVRASGSEIECVAQPGLGQGNEVSVTESGNTNTARVLNFASATVTLCGGSSSETVDLFATSSSKAVVSICGANFGEAADTTSNSDWTGRLDVLADKFNGEITLHEDNLIVVEFSTGSGKYNAVKVLFGSQLVVVPGVTVTFPPPTVTHVEERPLNTRSTLVRLAIFGKNFGNPAQTIVAVNIGNFKCNINVQHVSDSLIVCSVANGFGANVPVEVVVNGYSSLDVIQFVGQAPTTPVGAVAIVRYDFTNAAVPGYGCVPPAGAVDVINTDYCNCWSGYAPLLAQPGTECSVKATCPGRVASAVSANYFAPSRPTYKFEQDTFVIVQTQPIVANRRDTVIEFVTPNIPDRSPATAPGTAGSPTCMYPGVLWEKKVNELDCLDEFHGRMPWSQNEFCGWVEDTAAENIDNHVQKFKTNLVSTYTETYKAADGSLRFRKMSNSYLLTVSFTRQITAFTTSNVNVYINDPDSSLTVAVRDDAFYDVASHQVIINFETTIAWPYQLDDITLTGAWTKAPGSTEANTPTASAVLGVQGGDLECTTSQDTDCSQSWVLTISGDACDLHGSLAFNTGTLICRDLEDNAAPCLFTADTDFTIQLGKTDLCDDAAKTVDATEGLTHSMESFYDAAHTIPQNTFQTGDKVFFQVKLNDPISSIDAITFNGITLASSDDEDVLYQVQTIGDLPTDVNTVVMSVAEVNVTSEIRQPHSVISPGSEAVLTFEFRLLRNHLQSLAALTQTYEFTVSLTLTATVDIWYHGNQKRTVTVGATSSTAHASISYFNTEAEGQLEETHNNATPEADGWESEVSFFNGASITGVASVVAVLSTVAAVLLA